MDLSIQETKLKDLLKHALIEVLTERRELFAGLLREVLADNLAGTYPEEQIYKTGLQTIGEDAATPVARVHRTTLALPFKAGLAARQAYQPDPSEWYEQ